MPLMRLFEKAFKWMDDYPHAGSLVEFGVYRGETLEIISKLAWRHFADQPIELQPAVYGFDSFAGMPPSAVALQPDVAASWCEHSFNDTSLEKVQRLVPTAKLVQSVFENLPHLSSYGIDRVRFAHLDCDIYEGYRDALRLLTPHLEVGSVLLFDEGNADPDYPSILDHGIRAIDEWKKASGFRLHLLEAESTIALTYIGSRT